MKYKLLKNRLNGERSIRIEGQEELVKESVNPVEYARLRKLALKNLNSFFKDQAMRDCGLVKVRGNMGGTYWE